MSMAHQQLLDHILGIRGDQDQHLVADGQPGVAPGHDEAVVAHHGHHRGRPGGRPRSASDTPGGRRVVGQGDLDQVGVPALEAEQPDQAARPTPPLRPAR